MPWGCAPPLERVRKERGRKEEGWEEVKRKTSFPPAAFPLGSVECPALAPWLRPEWGLGCSSKGLGPRAPGVSSRDLGDSGEHQPDTPDITMLFHTPPPAHTEGPHFLVSLRQVGPCDRPQAKELYAEGTWGPLELPGGDSADLIFPLLDDQQDSRGGCSASWGFGSCRQGVSEK